MKNVASKMMKPLKNFKLKSLLQNKFVLYVLVLIALLNILMLANGKDFNSVIVFVIVGFLTSFFSKNMIVILLTALLFTHVLKYVNSLVRKEGMEDKKEKEGMKNKKNKKEGMENEEDEDVPVTEDNAEENKDEKKEEKEEEKMGSKEEELIKKKQTYDALKSDFTEFQSIQKDILNNMKEIDPLLAKAETFINKFEQYKKK